MDPSIADETVIRLLVGDPPSPEVAEENRYRGLPPEHFIRQYVEYAATLTDAPLVYHLGNAMGAIAAVCPPDVAIAGPAGLIAANLYVMLLGDSASSRKSTSMQIARRVVGRAVAECIGDTPGSKQGLEAALQERAQQILYYPEFSGFLAASQKNSAIGDLKLLLLDVFDGTPISRRLSNESVHCVAPRLSLVAGVAPSLFEAHTTTTDLTGGFASRFVILHGTRRTFRVPTPPDLGTEVRLAAVLRHIATGIPNIPIRISDSAHRYLWQTWIPQRDAVARRAAPEAQGLLMRALSPNLFKILILAAVADAAPLFPAAQLRPVAPDGSYLWASDAMIRFAMEFVDMYSSPSAGFLANVVTSPEMQLRRRVLQAVEQLCMAQPSHMAIEGEILREAKLSARTARIYLETLVAEGSIIKVGFSASGVAYQTPRWHTPAVNHAQSAAAAANRGI